MYTDKNKGKCLIKKVLIAINFSCSPHRLMIFGNRKDNVQKTLRELKERRKKYENLEKQLKSTDEDQVSTTDPQSRQLMIRGQITEVAYNVQTTVDSKHNLVIDVKAVNTNDKKMAAVMGRRAKAIIGHGNFDHLMDKGYHDGEKIDECQCHNIRTLISPPAASRSGEIPTPEFYNDKFIYNPQNDSYTCPAGQTLTSNGTLYNVKSWNGYMQIKQYKTRACRTCACHSKCTSSPKERGRMLQRSIYQDAVDENDQRVIAEKEKYRRRQEMVEHPFGVVKRQWSYDHVLLKGIEKVDAESNLIFLCYNLKRVINILGIKLLIKKLKEISIFFIVYGLKLIDIRIRIFLNPEIKLLNWIDYSDSNCLKRLNLNVNFL